MPGKTGILESESKSGPHKGTITKIRYFSPDGEDTFDRIYMDPDQVQRWRDHYLGQGYESRKLSDI